MIYFLINILQNTSEELDIKLYTSPRTEISLLVGLFSPGTPVVSIDTCPPQYN